MTHDHRKLLRRFLRRSTALNGAIIGGWLTIAKGSRNEILARDLEFQGFVRRGNPWVITLAGLAEAIGCGDVIDGSYLQVLLKSEALYS